MTLNEIWLHIEQDKLSFGGCCRASDIKGQMKRLKKLLSKKNLNLIDTNKESE